MKTCGLCGAANHDDATVCARCVQPFDHYTLESHQWIQTFSGGPYRPLAPRAQDVRVEDIAHHLGYICRFSGACTRFYSVAEHSSHVGHVVDAALMFRDDMAEENKRRVVLAAHLHDAEEYVPPHDVARPVKYSDQCAFLRDMGELNRAAIFEALGVEWPTQFADLIKDADNAMLLAEQETIMRPPPMPWVPIDVPADMLELARYRMELANNHGVGGAGSPDKAGLAWLLRYRELTEF